MKRLPVTAATLTPPGHARFDQADRDAIEILKKAICESGGINCYSSRQHVQVFWKLQSAIRHLIDLDAYAAPKKTKC